MQLQLMGILGGLVVEDSPASVAAAARVVSFWACAFKLAFLGLQKGRLSRDDARCSTCLHRFAGREEQYDPALSCDPPAL